MAAEGNAGRGAAAAGGGGANGTAGRGSGVNEGRVEQKEYSTALTTPLILSNILTGAQLIRAGVATPDEAYMWFDKFFRAEKDIHKNGKHLVDNLWLHSMGPKERAARWDLYLAGTLIDQEGYFNEGERYYRDQFVGSDRKGTFSPMKFAEYQKAVRQDKITPKHLKESRPLTEDQQKQMLAVKQKLAKWSARVSPRYYAYLLYALTAPLPDDVELNTNPYLDAHRYEKEIFPQSVFLNRVAKINTGKTRGGKRRATHKRSTTKRRSVTNKRRTSKRRQTKKRRS